jgi:hypothetical protein
MYILDVLTYTIRNTSCKITLVLIDGDFVVQLVFKKKKKTVGEYVKRIQII